MINWKGFGRKWTWPNFEVLSRHWTGGNDETTKTISIAGFRIEILTQDLLNTK
jgi:hypothetical protein